MPPVCSTSTIGALPTLKDVHAGSLSSKAKTYAGTTDTESFGPTISQAGIRPNAGKVHALVEMKISLDFKQSRSLLWHLPCYNHVPAEDGQLHPVNQLLPENVKRTACTSSMDMKVRSLSYLGHWPWWSTLIEMQAEIILGILILFCDATVY